MTEFRWNPGEYMKFGDDRLRPALDLLARIPLEDPKTVVDLGCGTGNVTRLLAERWPRASVKGIDSSSDMLAKAREAGSPPGWEEADIKNWSVESPVDLLFSNAALHWLDDHAHLFPHLSRSVAPGGVLAIQMPRNFGAPSHTEIIDMAMSGRWSDRLGHLVRPWPVAEARTYFDILAPHVRDLEIWETIYTQVFEGEDAVVDWVRSTALRPFLEALGAEERAAFLHDYAHRMRRTYPRREDGRTLYAMRRIFIVARL